MQRENNIKYNYINQTLQCKNGNINLNINWSYRETEREKEKAEEE